VLERLVISTCTRKLQTDEAMTELASKESEHLMDPQFERRARKKPTDRAASLLKVFRAGEADVDHQILRLHGLRRQSGTVDDSRSQPNAASGEARKADDVVLNRVEKPLQLLGAPHRRFWITHTPALPTSRRLPLRTVDCRCRRIGRSLARLAGKDSTQGIHAAIALSPYRLPGTGVNRNFFTTLSQAPFQFVRKLGFRECSGEPFLLKYICMSSESRGPRGSTKAAKPQGEVIGFPSVLDHHSQRSKPVLGLVLHSTWCLSEDGQKRTDPIRIETNRHFQGLPSRDRQGHHGSLSPKAEPACGEGLGEGRLNRLRLDAVPGQVAPRIRSGACRRSRPS
jgi:hypothetical protein